MYFVYIMGCLETRRTYVGQTDDLLRRYRMHREGTTRTTREKFKKLVVLHCEACGTRADAVRKEKYYKHGSGYRQRVECAEEMFRLFDPVG